MKSLDTPLRERKTVVMTPSIRSMAALLALAGLAPLAAQTQNASLSAVVETGSARQVREAFAAGANPNVRLPDGETPLADAAASNNNAGVIAALLAAGAAVGATDATGMTPLMWAAAENSNPDVTAALLAAGADANARNVIGITPLMFAAKENSNPEVAERLLAAGAKVNAHDINGTTPLMYAEKDNDLPKLIAVLLAAGADARPTGNVGKTALNHARPAATAGTPAAHPTVATTQPPAPLAPSDGRLVIDLEPRVTTQANVWLAIEGPVGTRFFPNLPQNRPLADELAPGSYRIRARFVGDSGTGYVGTVVVMAGEQTKITIPLAYSPAFMASLAESYRSLSQRIYRDRYVTLPSLERERAAKGTTGAVVEGLGVATAGMAGIFAYLSTSNPSSPAIYHGAALAGGAFSAVLLVWGTSLLVTRPSQSEINKLKASDRALDAQLHKLALIRESSSR